MVAAGFLAKLATKIGWKGFAMGSVGGLGGLLTGSALTGSGGGGVLDSVGGMFSNLGSMSWILLGLAVAAVLIIMIRGKPASGRR
jgi:hypothetical protein